MVFRDVRPGMVFSGHVGLDTVVVANEFPVLGGGRRIDLRVLRTWPDASAPPELVSYEPDPDWTCTWRRVL